jgi:hypothetical protein
MPDGYLMNKRCLANEKLMILKFSTLGRSLESVGSREQGLGCHAGLPADR